MNMIYLSRRGDGRIAVWSGSLFGDDRTARRTPPAANESDDKDSQRARMQKEAAQVFGRMLADIRRSEPDSFDRALEIVRAFNNRHFPMSAPKLK